MAFAVRTSAFTEPDRPKDLQIRYLTVGGAHVDVTGSGEHPVDRLPDDARVSRAARIVGHACSDGRDGPGARCYCGLKERIW
ncbi:hypothetical protein [Streptomyces sp. AN091965]|uniref:hypothetical protein n=1 Tax=Streptomyces sp. AN091965 TaxID=2927803 RepID=UPI001F614B7D|nr:hypothetical protein [Streptomyces sp. AN091965]MCI3927856.1 hypothetical protein [Streptomyces sp. AN091965]